MLIRAATPADLPHVKAMWNAMIRDTTATFTTAEKTDADLAALLAARGQAFLVAEHDGRCAGFVTLGRISARAPAMPTRPNIRSSPSRPGQGTGRVLMQAAEREARAAGLHVLVAGISGENTAALRFHARLGFAKSGHLSQVGHKNGRWLDLVFMTKIIGPT